MSEAKYEITVKTSSKYGAADSKSYVELNLVGGNGHETGFHNLNGFFTDIGGVKNYGKRYNLSIQNVGVPVIVKIRVEAKILGKPYEWMCNDITVELEGQKAYFPVYDWITSEMEVTRGEAVLPQHLTNQQVKTMRQNEISSNKNKFKWIPNPKEGGATYGLPRFIDAAKYEELPSILKRTDTRKDMMNTNQRRAYLRVAKEKGKALFSSLKTLEDYHKVYKVIDEEHVEGDILNRSQYFQNWKSDEDFGRQILTGISPLMVKRCTELPSYFNVTNDDVSEFLNGQTLSQQIKNGKIYISDYTEVLADVERNPYNKDTKFHCANAVALFFSNPEGKFMPIAIQLEPNKPEHLFTPADRPDDWMLAKMHFRCAFTNYHEWIAHLLLTHVITEPFSVALFRNLPKSHPIYKLMRPHLEMVSSINVDARVTLLPPSSIVNVSALAVSAGDLATKIYKTFHMDQLNIPQLLKKNGTDDPNLLPGYYYRDDALAFWKIIEKYVSGVINYFYKSDKDVIDDYELQGFAHDVATNGLGWQDFNTRGMPKNITSVSKLIEICLSLIFTSSAQHAAVNFGQYETYKFVPNCPGLMNLPPHKKGEANDKTIMKSLPDHNQSIAIMAVVNILSRFSPDEIYLGTFEENFFVEREVKEIQFACHYNLKDAEGKIIERNKSLDQDYTYLLRVPKELAVYMA